MYTIRELRERQNISQGKLARLLGCSQPLISHLESRLTRPGERFLTRLSQLFDVPVSDLDVAKPEFVFDPDALRREEVPA